MITVWEKAKETEKPVLIYGTGNGADKIIDELSRLGIPVSGIFASDGFVRNRTFRGFPVMGYTQAKEQFGDFLTLISFGSQREDVISGFLKVADERETYSVDVPVYGDNIFNREFFESHKDEIEKVYSLLEDDKSREVYENVIGFKLTGRMNLLTECETDRDEAFRNILKLSDSETYMDLGAFNGDTALEFVNTVPSYRKIYAAEPDIKNFRKLENNTQHLENIKRLNVCISDNCGEITFSKHGGRNCTADEKGIAVKCATVDSILGGKEVSYIKFDVEGFEKEAIDGAKETIKHHKPKMLISCYHRSEDIFSIPLQVLSIRNDYKLYIRHNPYIPAWDTQFYFV